MSNYKLLVQRANGAIESATPDEILTAARQILTHRVRRGTPLSSPRLVKDFLTIKLGALEHEMFCVLLLDLCGATVYAETLHIRPR
jgi:DNA repair protein RadC